MAIQKKNYIFPLIIIAMTFFVIGFGVGINGIMVPVLEGAFNLSKGMSYVVLAATFSAFLIFGAPAGWIIKKIGYKKTLSVAFFIMALGMLLFVPSAKMSTSMTGFYMFLLATFVGGIGNTMLQASVNPYVTICGPIEKAAQRMCMMGIANKSAWWLGPLFISLFIDVKQPQLSEAVIPFAVAAGVIAALGVFILFIALPEVKAAGEDETEDTAAAQKPEVVLANKQKSIWAFPHLILGALALFIYVGVETLPMASVIGYAKAMGVADPASYSLIVPVGLVIGYVISIFVLQVLPQTKALLLFIGIALLATLLLIFLPPKYSIYCLAGLGFSHAVMWGAIWALAIDKLGKFTKSGSSMLVIAIVGGAIIPLIFAFALDALTGAGEAVPADYQNAYWIFIPCYLFMLYYALAGHKLQPKKRA